MQSFAGLRVWPSSGHQHLFSILSTEFPARYGIPDGIAKYACPDAGLAADLRFSEAIQPVTRHSFRRNPVPTDFTP